MCWITIELHNKKIIVNIFLINTKWIHILYSSSYKFKVYPKKCYQHFGYNEICYRITWYYMFVSMAPLRILSLILMFWKLVVLWFPVHPYALHMVLLSASIMLIIVVIIILCILLSWICWCYLFVFQPPHEEMKTDIGEEEEIKAPSPEEDGEEIKNDGGETKC